MGTGLLQSGQDVTVNAALYAEESEVEEMMEVLDQYAAPHGIPTPLHPRKYVYFGRPD